MVPTMRMLKKSGWFLPALVLIALVPRLLYFNEIRTRADFENPGLDAGYHDYWARGLAFGQWAPPHDQPDPMVQQLPYFRPPGYPYFLALVYALTGGSHAAARLLQFALGILNAVLLYLLARQIFGEMPARIGALLAATFWTLIYYEGELLEPVLSITLLLLLLFAFHEWTRSMKLLWLAGAGVLMGLSALVRPNALLFLPVAVLWAAWYLRGHSSWLRETFRAAVLLSVGLAVTVLPATIRNYVVARDVVLISANSGINLLLGQDPDAIVDHASDETGHWNCFQYPALLASASAEAGRDLKPSEASRWHAQKAWHQIVTRPRVTAQLMVLKTLLFWGPLEVSNNKVEELERTASPVLRGLTLRFSFLFAWSLVGLFGAWRAMRGGASRAATAMAVLIVLLVGIYFGSFLPYIAAGQYRAPIVPLLAAFAGVGLWEALRPLLKGNLRTAACWLVPGLVLWGLASINVTGYRPNEAHWHLMRGISEERAGNLAAAEGAFREAVQTRPALDVAHQRLGAALAQQERYEEAIESFERVLELTPDNVDARHSIGLALALLGRVEEAIPHFEAVVRARPGYREARHNLQQAYWVTGRTPPPDL